MPSFKGGVYVNKMKRKRNGKPCPTRYLRISAGPLRNRYVHELVMEAKLGRELEPGETVEHENGDGLDARPSNLKVMSYAANTSAMHARRKRQRQQRDDATEFDPSKL